MGRSSHPPVIQHNSHLHPLHLTSNPSPARCAACGNPTTPGAHAYTCKPCNYTLHASCSTLPYVLSHPSHPPHDLHLHFSPAYSLEKSFFCDACGLRGTAFSYHCPACDFDLHPHCALLPASFIHPAHFHPLSLSFSSPYADESYTCDVCGNPGAGGRWLYRCSMGCEFDAHLGCIVAAAPSSPVRFQQVVAKGVPVSAKPRGPVVKTWQPARTLAATMLAGNGLLGQRRRFGRYSYNHGQQKIATEAQPYNHRPSAGNSPMQKIFPGEAQGHVEGVAQQLAQTVVQDFTGSEYNDDSSNNYNRSTSSSGSSRYGGEGEDDDKSTTITIGGKLPEADTFNNSSAPLKATAGDEQSPSLREANNDCTVEANPATEVKAPVPTSRRRWRAFRQRTLFLEPGHAQDAVA